MDLGRSVPCNCGSGKKFKHCCEGKAASIIPILASAELNLHIALYNADHYAELETRARHLAGRHPAFGFSGSCWAAKSQVFTAAYFPLYSILN